MKNMIDGIDFHELPAQKYWAPPASWTPERKRQEVYDAVFSGEYTGARKMDGAFYKFVKDEDGEMELLGRSKSVSGDYLDKIEWVPQLKPFFDDLPNGTCLLGEIYFPDDEGSNKVTTIMGCLVEKALARQKTHPLHYYVFDVLAWDGKVQYKSSIENRTWILNNIEFAYGGRECVEFAHYFEGAELWEEYQSILAEGGEGVVITRKGTCYQPDKRPARQTFKLKKELQETIDVVILDKNEPTRLYGGKEITSWQYWEDIKTGEKLKGDLYKEYSDGNTIEPVTKAYWNGWAGSLVIGVRKDDKLVVVGSLSGLTEEVLENWRDYKGKVAEITGMQVFATGGIRHPRFLRWRDDLTPRDTDWYRIFGGM